MEKIAMILGNTTLTWSGMILVLASLGALLLFLGLYLGKDGSALAGFAAGGLSLVLGILFARWIHWYCYTETYDGLLSAMTNLKEGGFGLVGVFAGCLTAAVLTRVGKLHRNLPQMLDCMCLAGLSGLAVGRLASFFNSTDRGQILGTMRSLPWAYPVTNAVSGAAEYRLATFLLQAMVAAVLLIALLLLFRRKDTRAGDTTWVFLLVYGASQVVLDSTRYDSMYFRWNGFVSIVQVLGAVALVAAIVVFSRRLVKNRGMEKWYWAVWLGILACLGGAGYMEYHVQRHGSQALFAYSVMSACLTVAVALGLLLRHLAQRPVAEKSTGRYLRKD